MYSSRKRRVNCLEADEDKFGNIQCIECIKNYPFIWCDIYNHTICDDKCLFGYILKDDYCYPFNVVMPGCNSAKNANILHQMMN